jgi:hypothetical protein
MDAKLPYLSVPVWDAKDLRWSEAKNRLETKTEPPCRIDFIHNKSKANSQSRSLAEMEMMKWMSVCQGRLQKAPSTRYHDRSLGFFMAASSHGQP